jgi:hypothetical protein
MSFHKGQLIVSVRPLRREFCRSIAGNEGQCDYAYANGFLDHFAEYREQKRQNSLRSGRTLTINWPYNHTGLRSLQ